MDDKATAESLCKWLEPVVEPAGMSGAFWRAAGPRGKNRVDASIDIRAHKEAIVAALEAARRSVTDAARGSIIDCTGEVPVVRRVLGTFVLTEDGAVACEEGGCWCVVRATEDDPWTVRKCRRSGNPEDYGCWWQVDDWSDFGGCIVGKVYSTESAAKAAMEGGKA